MSPSFNSNRVSSKNGLANIITNRSNNNNSSAAANNNNHKSNGNDAIIETNEMQRHKSENIISNLTTQIQRLNKELEIEKHSRDTHFAKIVRALLYFEAKLKTDQKQIRLQLYEKDTQLNRLAHEVKALREKYDVKDDEPLSVDATALYCPNCRKQYYSLTSSDAGVQCSKHELMCHDGLDKGKYKYTMNNYMT